MGTSAVEPSAAPAHEEHLERNLSNRHVQLIAIGGAIGTGLFLGSGKTIQVAGPSILLVYVIVGVMLFFVMRAMGELLLHNLDYKSFQDFATEMLGPWAGFFTGWTYWLCWVVTGMAEIIAVAGYWNFWINPNFTTVMSPWSLLATVLTLAVLLTLNLLTVKLFGETEFWFALIKVIAIVALICVGLYMLFTGFRSPDGVQSSVTYLWTRNTPDGLNGFFPHGLSGFAAGFPIAIFAFVGIELVGTTAAETKDPTKTLPKAINSIPVRVVIFYVLSLAVIMSITPWDSINPDASPFVSIFGLAGIASAAHVMNFVVLTSASSSCNSGLFSTSRMLFGLSHKGMAPTAFGKLSSHKVPRNALLVSVALVSTAIILMLSESVMGAFTLVTGISAMLFLFVWTIILVSYVVYLKRFPEAHAKSIYKMPGAHFMPYVVMGFFAIALCIMLWDEGTRPAAIATPIWFVILGIAWMQVRKHVHRDDAGTDAVEPDQPTWAADLHESVDEIGAEIKREVDEIRHY